MYDYSRNPHTDNGIDCYRYNFMVNRAFDIRGYQETWTHEEMGLVISSQGKELRLLGKEDSLIRYRKP